jgi:hypothetical protein
MGWEKLTLRDEVNAADWIRERLHPFAKDVGSVVPSGFPAYARIFHPAGIAGRPELGIRWSEVASLTGKTAHPEMQFHAIAPPPHDPEPHFYEPRLGVLSPSQASALVAVLSKHTSTPDVCWLCLWEGYGYLHPGGSAVFVLASRGRFARLRVPLKRLQLRWSMPRPPRKQGPRVRLPGRDYLLFRAPIAEALGWEDGPNLWWPDDHAWCVASEIDFPYTYVGGSKELVDAIVNDPAIEALPAKDTDGITYTSDKVNS